MKIQDKITYNVKFLFFVDKRAYAEVTAQNSAKANV